MRNLTVKREKTYVGSLAKIKLYVPDAQNGTLTIMGTPCRLLGELKNGEEKTFSIPSEETGVYAIADKLSKDYCNDWYHIPAGEEDLHVSGKCKFSLGSNAFCFAGQETAQKQQLRKKNSRKGFWILLICCILGVVVGGIAGRAITGSLTSKEPEAKLFAVEDMRITLTDAFTQQENDRFTAALVSRDVGVTVIKEPFALAPGCEDLSLEEYGHLVITNNGIIGTMLCTENGLTFFEFDRENQETKQVFTYFAAVYKTEDAFWLVQFGTLKADYSSWRATLESWARSVTFV